jgi:hypothetical protein
LDELSRHLRVKEAAVEAGELKAAAAAAARLRGTVAELTPDCLTIHRRFIFTWLASSS